MARVSKPPRLVKWRGGWYIFWTDRRTGKRERTACSTMGAETGDERKQLLDKMRERELRDIAEKYRLGGAMDFRRPLKDAVNDYIQYLKKQATARKANPDARSGLNKTSAYTAALTPRLFLQWLERTQRQLLRCEELDGPLLQEFMAWLASSGYRRSPDGKALPRGASTMNRHRDKLGTCLRWLDAKRPRLFPDSGAFWYALKHVRAPARRGIAYTPKQLAKFYSAAQSWGSPKPRKRKVRGKVQRYGQRPSELPATPPDRLFLLCALTGCRRQEALNLRWADVDLERGRVTFTAGKTGSWRILPLTGAPEGEVAPGFLETLRAWKRTDPKAEYVLPHRGIDRPEFPKHAWRALMRVEPIGPQRLRSNFTSYAASLGIPPAVCAMWQGHSLAVAERHYRQQVLERLQAGSIEAAMGLGRAQHQP